MRALTQIACLAAGLLLAPAAARPESILIEAMDEGGMLTWSNTGTNATARVQWAPTLTGRWESGWSDMQDIAATQAVASRPIPRFFRVLASTNRAAGADLAGWEVVLGDGLFAPDGVPPPTTDDIATAHLGDRSELTANVQQRHIMAHNITFRRVFDHDALAAIHRSAFDFRLSHLPATSNTTHNGQTFEAALFVWDGTQTRMDYGGAFQWELNPWNSTFGDLLCWSGIGSNAWIRVGSLPPDTNWHRVGMDIDFRTRRTALTIDSNQYLFAFTATPRPGWDSNTAARLQVEAISAFPGPTGYVHQVEIRDWHWAWEP